MASYKEHIQNETVNLTIYTPEAIMGGLQGAFDSKIYSQTRCQPIYRQWLQFTPETLDGFYFHSKIKHDPVLWSLACNVMTYGPSLITIWHGSDTINKLIGVKGSTIPSNADPNSIRGGFWCDNPLCNLIHCSDSPSELLRELKAIGLEHLFERNINSYLGFPFCKEYDFSNIHHSGIVSLYRSVLAMLRVSGQLAFEKIESLLNIPETANEANIRLTELLFDLSNCMDDKSKEYVQAFLLGNEEIQNDNDFDNHFPNNNWEKLMIKCSMVSRRNWIKNKFPKYESNKS